jgi:hypothetical protein
MERRMPTNTDLYHQDLYAWTQEQAALLDARQFDALDLANLIEELLDVGSSQYLAVSSAVYQILVHLLKWQYQPGKRSRSWRTSLLEHRTRIPRHVRRSPSLRGAIPQMLIEEYPGACRKASVQTGLPLATFPEHCPWTIEQVLDEDFWPEEDPPHDLR